MAGLIPENILEDILSKVDIVEVISAYIPLKRSGRNFKANCPFHHEKTPSFMVSPDRQIYHCFGCGESGNAFKFLMRYERLEFPEAVEIMAKKCGVILPEKQVEDTQTNSLYTQLYKINELAAIFYQEALETAMAAKAKDYLLKRGVSEQAIKLFRLGFAPDKWDGLINHLRAKNIHLSLLEKAGLVLPRDNGGFYDRFRNRIIFPILDIKSRVLGFGARALAGDDKTGAKYINSPETMIYTKGRNLYGLNFAKEAIRVKDYVAIVEGYMDFIVPYQAGFQNLVASQGTALTLDQVSLLKRHTHNVVMVFDADQAGQAATLRMLDVFVEEGMNVKVAALPAGFDPDLYVRKYGLKGFEELIEKADNLFDYKLKSAKSRFNYKQIEGKAKISQEMLPTISKFKNAVLKSEYIKRLSEELAVREDALLEELSKIKEVVPFAPLPQATGKKAFTVNPTEKLLIKLMLEENELIARVRQRLEPDDFQDKKISELVSVMFELTAQGKEAAPSKLVNYLTDTDSLQFICESAFNPGSYEQNKEEVINDCIKVIKHKKLHFLRQRLQEEIKIAEDSGNEEKLSQLKVEFCDLTKKGRKEL
ncbi:MAG: DNA primase [Candidatus Omnitrophica bacterium]|jgi:DNA primase|nr:DNA primase [Candidatus Omnitrophota bacterium]